MTVIKVAHESEQVPTAGEVGYTCPSTAKYAEVTFGLCTNEDASNDSLTVYVIASGGSAADTNIYIDGRTITAAGNDTLDELIGLVLEPGDKVVPRASAADRLNFKLGIKEVY